MLSLQALALWRAKCHLKFTDCLALWKHYGKLPGDLPPGTTQEMLTTLLAKMEGRVEKVGRRGMLHV